MALDALQALQARGIRVPKEMAVVGLDDFPMSRLASPPLTTANFPVMGLPEQANKTLLKSV